MFMLTVDLIRNSFYREPPSPISQPTERFTIEHTVFEYQITEYFASSRALKTDIQLKIYSRLAHAYTQGEKERERELLTE